MVKKENTDSMKGLLYNYYLQICKESTMLNIYI